MDSLLFVLLCLSLSSPTNAFVAYDCQHPDTKQMVLDIMAPGKCPDPTTDFKPKTLEDFQMIQAGEDTPVMGYQCLVVATKKVTVCGNWARSSVTYGSRDSQWEKVEDVSAEDCWKAVRTGKLRVWDREYPTQLGETTKHSFFSHGGVDDRGYCTTAASFLSNNVMYTNAFESVRMSITLRKINGIHSHNNGLLKLSLGLRAMFEDATIFDLYKGRIVWDNQEIVTCDRYLNAVYQGPGEVRETKVSPDRRDAIVVTNQRQPNGQHMGLVLGTPVRLCGKFCHTVASLRKMVVCFFRDDRPQFPNATLQVLTKSQGDDMMEANGKAWSDYSTMTLSLEMQLRFESLSGTICDNRRRILYNKLQAVSGAQNPHALLDIFGPGHLITPAGGAVAYVTECVPVEVGPKDVGNCTNEVPVVKMPGTGSHRSAPLLDTDPEVLKANETVFFMDPLTLVLRKFGTVVPCSLHMPVRWLLNDQWKCADAHGSYPCADAPVKLEVNYNASHTSSGFLTGMKGTGFLTPHKRAMRDRYMDAVSHRDAVTARTIETLIDSSNGYKLGSFVQPRDLAAAGEEWSAKVLGLMTISWMYHAFGAYAQLVLLIITGVSVVTSVTAGVGRFIQEFSIYGWNGGRTLGNATMALIGLATTPIRWAVRMAKIDQQELNGNLRDPETGRRQGRRRPRTRSHSVPSSSSHTGTTEETEMLPTTTTISMPSAPSRPQPYFQPALTYASEDAPPVYSAADRAAMGAMAAAANAAASVAAHAAKPTRPHNRPVSGIDNRDSDAERSRSRNSFRSSRH